METVQKICNENTRVDFSTPSPRGRKLSLS